MKAEFKVGNCNRYPRLMMLKNADAVIILIGPNKHKTIVYSEDKRYLIGNHFTADEEECFFELAGGSKVALIQE